MAIHEGTRNREFEQGCQILLLALAAVALVALLPPAIELVGATLERSQSAGVACNSCGVVEDMREVPHLASKHVGSTVTGGGVASVAVFLRVLGGHGMASDPHALYEISVRLQDGSVRVLQSSAPPAWKRGDRVRIVMGRIQPAL
jgi:hypothetical protein